MQIGPTYTASQLSASSSSSLLTSGKTTADFMSSSLTNLILLHPARQRRARVDWTDKQLRTCESTSRLWLNVHSTSTEVAVIIFMSRYIFEHKRNYLGLTGSPSPSDTDEDRYVSAQTTRLNRSWRQALNPCSGTFLTHRIAQYSQVPGGQVNHQRCLRVGRVSKEVTAKIVMVGFSV